MKPATSPFIRHNDTFDGNPNEIKALAVCRIETPSRGYPAQRHKNETARRWHQIFCAAVPDRGNLCRDAVLPAARAEAPYSLGCGVVVPMCLTNAGMREQRRTVVY